MSLYNFEPKYKNLNLLKYIYEKPAVEIRTSNIIYGERLDKFYTIESYEVGKILECNTKRLPNRASAPDCKIDELMVIEGFCPQGYVGKSGGYTQVAKAYSSCECPGTVVVLTLFYTGVIGVIFEEFVGSFLFSFSFFSSGYNFFCSEPEKYFYEFAVSCQAENTLVDSHYNSTECLFEV